jgi:cytochrome o ubiquinol oxidase operon protein cyoD
MNRTPFNNAGASSGSLKSYGIGFVLSIGLTAISFALVMSGILSRPPVLAGLIVAAVVQMLVHLHYFLHLDMSSDQRWNLLTLIFTVMILVLFVGGSLWIMYNLNYRMM